MTFSEVFDIYLFLIYFTFRVLHQIFLLFSELISTMIGGQAEIQSIEPYSVYFQDRKDIGNFDIDFPDNQR